MQPAGWTLDVVIFYKIPGKRKCATKQQMMLHIMAWTENWKSNRKQELGERDHFQVGKLHQNSSAATLTIYPYY